MSDELKERNTLKLISIVRYACATLDVGHPIFAVGGDDPHKQKVSEEGNHPKQKSFLLASDTVKKGPEEEEEEDSNNTLPRQEVSEEIKTQ
jgi:hypothetical protein